MPSIDLHCDVPWQCYKNNSAINLEGSTLLQVDLAKARKGRLDKFVAALYLSDGAITSMGDKRAWNEILNQAAHMQGWPDQVLLALEGGRMLDETRIAQMASMGIVYITLTHNSNTSWADSATDKLMHNGLTSVGKRLVRLIEEHKILVDVSHTSDQTALDVLTQASRPVIASHSGVRSLVDHPRNLSDFLIKEIAKTGGVIGIPYASRFVTDRDGVVLAIDHIAQLLGTTRHLAIGSDLDGAATIIKDASEWADVLEPLLDMGYTDDDLTGIKGGNFLRLKE